MVKKSACNVGDLVSVPALGRKDPLEQGLSTHCSVLAWRTPADRGAWRGAVRGVTELDITERLSTA